MTKCLKRWTTLSAIMLACACSAQADWEWGTYDAAIAYDGAIVVGAIVSLEHRGPAHFGRSMEYDAIVRVDTVLRCARERSIQGGDEVACIICMPPLDEAGDQARYVLFQTDAADGKPVIGPGLCVPLVEREGELLLCWLDVVTIRSGRAVPVTLSQLSDDIESRRFQRRVWHAGVLAFVGFCLVALLVLRTRIRKRRTLSDAALP